MSAYNTNQNCCIHNKEAIAINLIQGAQLQDMILCIQCLTESASKSVVPIMQIKDMTQKIVNQQNSVKMEVAQMKSTLFAQLIDLLQGLKRNFNNSVNAALSVIKDSISQQQQQTEECQKEQNIEELTLEQMVNKITSNQWGYCQDKMKEDEFYFIQNLQNELQQYKNVVDVQNIFLLAEKAKQQIKIKMNQREQKEQKRIDFFHQSTPKLDFLCSLHNKEIIMLDLKPSVLKEKRLCCIECMPTQYASLELGQEKWRLYQSRKREFLQQQILDREQSYEMVKDQILKIEQSIIELIREIQSSFEKNMKQVKQNILSSIDLLEKDWWQLTYEEVLDRAELLSKSEDLQIRQIQTEYQEIQESIIIKLQEQIQQLKLYQQNLYDNLRSTLCFSQEISKATSQSDQQNVQNNHQYQIIENKISEQVTSTQMESRRSHDFQDMNNNLFNSLYVRDEIRQTRSASAQIQRIYREERIQELQDSEEQDKIHYELIDKVEQEKICYAIAFNYDRSLMINGSQNDIVISNFIDGKIERISVLQGHTSQVISLCFSTLKNEFASGSTDKTIRYWQLDNNNQWVCTQILEGHKRQIDCLLIDNKDNSIISCSSDKSIRVWRKNKNLFWIQVQVLTNHQQQVRCISFSKSYHQLVSCSEDSSIIIWEIDKFKEWKVKQLIQCNDYGYRICFIEDNQIAWQPRNMNQVIFYEFDQKEGRYRQSQFSIELSDSSDGYQNFFPSIYNDRRQILINKHGQFVYILQRNSKQQFSIAQTIDIEHYCNYGAVTRNGEYLVIWDEGSKCISVRKAMQ